ncbi:MAG: hypothetical protein KDD61_10785 [Bdellovibrionales bacterium]|nr:hypothetical protein [Bdellovibrionales bacterium]
MKFLWIVAVLVFCFISPSFADEIVQAHIVGTSSIADRGRAIKEMTGQAIEDVTLKYVTELIGESKTLKNSNLIKTKIVQQSSRYGLLIKNSPVKASSGKLSMEFDLKISVTNLKNMLLKEGLLYSEDGPPEVLPMVSISDKVSAQSYSWWVQESNQETAYIKGLMQMVHKQLNYDLFQRGFFGFKPIRFGLNQSVPEIFRNGKLRKEDSLNLGFLLGASVVILGNIELNQEKKIADTYKVDVELVAVHTGSGRIVGEVIRSYQTGMGSYKSVVKTKLTQEVDKFSRDLTEQLKEAWKKGIFDASLLKVAFVGKRLSYAQLENLKKEIIGLRYVKSMKERFFGPDQVVFEMDSNLSVDDLAKRLTGKNLAGLELGIGEIQNFGLTFTIK